MPHTAFSLLPLPIAPFINITSTLLMPFKCVSPLPSPAHQAPMCPWTHPRTWSWLCATQRSEVDFASLRITLCWLCVTEVTLVPPPRSSTSGVQDLFECNTSFQPSLHTCHSFISRWVWPQIIKSYLPVSLGVWFVSTHQLPSSPSSPATFNPCWPHSNTQFVVSSHFLLKTNFYSIIHLLPTSKIPINSQHVFCPDPIHAIYSAQWWYILPLPLNSGTNVYLQTKWPHLMHKQLHARITGW